MTKAHIFALVAIIYLGIGSNLGDRVAELEQSIEFLKTQGEVISVSPHYESEALEMSGAPPFINASVKLTTATEPLTLIKSFELYAIERGRVWSEEGYVSRPIDIDLLLYGRFHFRTPSVIVPHAKMLERKFVLEPLNEIASGQIIPGMELTVKEALQMCQDPTQLQRLK